MDIRIIPKTKQVQQCYNCGTFSIQKEKGIQ